MVKQIAPGLLIAAVFHCSSFAAALQANAGDRQVDFSRDVQPILSDTCFQCHGPDPQQRQAELRLDVQAGIYGQGDGGRIVTAGDPMSSELYRRITASDPDVKMPPPESGRSLRPDQIDTLRRWIEQGAKWGKHWSFLAPRRPTPPHAPGSSWRRNPIDDFIFDRLQRAAMTPSVEADRATLIRRVTLDLTGLPPRPEEVDAFLSDPSPDAYERRIDRLLSSPRYGERMAMQWLDVARFADTSGYQTDGVRDMWRWRDWVIDAYNRNQPFDQFTIEQLAGDLLPDPTLEQQIATGFNRNHRTNSEGGIVFEEYLFEYAADRLETTATVWLGLTLGCARCHDHKFDPFTQRDYYQLLAFFNNLPERGRVIKYGNSAPIIKAPTRRQQAEWARLRRAQQTAQSQFDDLQREIRAAQNAWERGLWESTQTVDWSIDEGLAAYYPLDSHLKEASGGPEGSYRPGAAVFAEGVRGESACFDGRSHVEIKGLPAIEGSDRFSLGAWFYGDDDQDAALLSFMDDDDSRDKGLSLHRLGKRIRVDYGPRWLDDAIRVETEALTEARRWQHVMITYDGSQRARGLKIYLDGIAVKTRALLDIFTGTMKLEVPMSVGARGGELHLRGRIDEPRLYMRTLSPWEVGVLACVDPVSQIARRPIRQRQPIERHKIDYYFLNRAAPDFIRQAYCNLRDSERRLQAFEQQIPDTMVMRERPQRRETFVLLRGQYDRPGERVEAGLPAGLSQADGHAPMNRLSLAKWLVDPRHPLTSRVAVNRYWQMHFGFGLVRTPEDFGSQGARPTHPRLLDWLAVEFRESGWDVKAMHRLMVTSATYRQSSRVDRDSLVKDPDNRLLARFPRWRLPAETIRDQALFASGLLSGGVGGPSVKPYQPAGLWKEIASDSYQQGEGEDLYRRSMYTFWKRTVPPPSMTTFDAGSRETCVLRRSQTNTPLQALALMNDPIYVEAARALALRMLGPAEATAAERIRRGFRLALGRPPNDDELATLTRGWRRQRERFQQNPAFAQQFLSGGQRPTRREHDLAEWAAYATTASILLNLDETITRE